ncbi:hypothetical protein IAU60_005102 [Kwoniella sp. DSM 27419]
MATDQLPKAILYSWPTSVWSTVPQLCLSEKGYSEDEYMVKHVDIRTIPTLVVPTLETTGADVDTRYRSLRDTVSICDFLDYARSSNSGHASHPDKPAPSLAPATIEGKALSDTIIGLIHLPTVDPNFLALTAQDAAELKLKASRPPGQSLTGRKEALQRYLEEAKKAVAGSTVAAKEGHLTWDQKTVKFLEEKLQSNEQLWELYNGKAGDERQKVFFEVSRKSWTEALPEAFNKLEDALKGPYALGDQIPHLGGYTFGSKLKEFWSLWVERDSFKKVLVPATGDFAKMSGL